MSIGGEIRIGVDARPLCHPGTGIFRHTVELLRRLCQRGGQWYFYSPQPYDSSAFQLPNVRHRHLPVPRQVRGSQLAHLVFPWWARRDGLQVFWGTRHQLPRLPQGVRRVLTLHDLVWRRHGDTMRFPGRQLEALFTPRALARAHVIAAVSDFTAAEAAYFYPTCADKLVTVSGASVLEADTLPPAEQGRSGAYFLFVGTMEPRKNLPRLLRAYQRYLLWHNGTGAARRLKLVGASGWGGENLPELIERLGLGEQVEILGRVSDGELALLYRDARALLMPSLYEGFGLPVIEAMAAGVPAMTSRHSPMAEVAGPAALLVDPQSEEEMAEAIRRLCRDASVHRSLRDACRARVARYSWDSSAEGMWRLLTGASPLEGVAGDREVE